MKIIRATASATRAVDVRRQRLRPIRRARRSRPMRTSGIVELNAERRDGREERRHEDQAVRAHDRQRAADPPERAVRVDRRSRAAMTRLDRDRVPRRGVDAHLEPVLAARYRSSGPARPRAPGGRVRRTGTRRARELPGDARRRPGPPPRARECPRRSTDARRAAGRADRVDARRARGPRGRRRPSSSSGERPPASWRARRRSTARRRGS